MQERNEREGRWHFAQREENNFWKRAGVLNGELRRVIARYGPIIAEISQNLDPNSNILDVGCGPTCAGQIFSVGVKTYLDPLMESYLRNYPEKLPVGKKICGTAESVPEQDERFDVVICVNALDHMINPSKSLFEMCRVLKKDGIFVLGIFLHPLPIALARRLIERYLPFFREEAHPFSFTLKSIKMLLGKYFYIQREIRVFRKDSALIPSAHREDWMFLCRKK